MRFTIKAVIDKKWRGRDAGEVLDGKYRDIPIFATIEDYMQVNGKPDVCIVGVATKGGKIPLEVYEHIEEAMKARIDVISGLHEFVSEHEKFKPLMEEFGVNVIDIRRPKPREELHFWKGHITKVDTPRIAVLGTDCNIGKRTTAKFLAERLQQENFRAEMIYTGQTGWMQGNKYGFIFDATLNDFISGELEHAIVSCYNEANPDVMILEGQSSLRNPTGPGGSEFLVSGQAKYVVLQHAAGRTYFDGCEALRLEIPPLQTEIDLIESYGSKVLAVTLHTNDIEDEDIPHYKEKYQQEVNVPVLLPLQEGMDPIIPTIASIIQRDPTYENQEN